MDNLGENHASMALFNRRAGGIAQRRHSSVSIILAGGYPLATARLNA